MRTVTAQERAVWQGRALDLVDRAIDEVYEKILKPDSRKHLGLEDLMHCENVEPQFEYRLDVHYKLRQKFPELRLPQSFWFYSLKGLVRRELVTGALIGGDLMVIEAATREGADKIAAEGLAHTLEIAKDLKYNALMLPDVVEDPADATDLVADGRRVERAKALYGDRPLNAGMAEKLNRIFADRGDRMKARFGAKNWRNR